MLRAVDVGMLPALGIDAQLERGTLPAIQQAEAVAQPVVLPRLGRPEADPRCSNEAVSDRPSRNRDLRGRPPDALAAAGCQPGHRLPAPQRPLWLARPTKAPPVP